MRTISGTILAVVTAFFAATSACAWGPGHDTVARETLKHLPGEWGERLRSGEGGELNAPYGIPYRCLLPCGTSNVLIAGRCASFSSIAASSCRLSRTMMQLGEAAGTAAYLSVTRGIPLRDVQASDIRSVMERRLDAK